MMASVNVRVSNLKLAQRKRPGDIHNEKDSFLGCSLNGPRRRNRLSGFRLRRSAHHSCIPLVTYPFLFVFPTAENLTNTRLHTNANRTCFLPLVALPGASTRRPAPLWRSLPFLPPSWCSLLLSYRPSIDRENRNGGNTAYPAATSLPPPSRPVSFFRAVSPRRPGPAPAERAPSRPEHSVQSTEVWWSAPTTENTAEESRPVGDLPGSRRRWQHR